MSTYTFAAVEARKLAGDVVPMDASQAGVGKLAFTLRVPIGVVGAISPFNFPLNLVAHKIAPALAAGCPVVLKPATATPLSALLLAELEQEAGLPPGWLNVLVGPAAEIGDVLVEDERVKLISFTGSSGVGWGLAERAPKKRVRLELGNATPVVVGPGADLEEAAGKLAANAFSFAGQSCISVQRIYVERDRYDEFVSAFVPKVEALKLGDPADEETDVGPVIDEQNRDRILEWIRGSGGEILTGGDVTDEGLIRPTVIGNPPPDAQGVVRRGLRPRLHDHRGRLVRPGDRARERDPLRAAGRRLHQRCPAGAERGAAARVRRRDDQRGTDVPRGPDAVRGREGLRQHPRGPRVHDPRDDGGADRRAAALVFAARAWPGRRHWPTGGAVRVGRDGPPAAAVASPCGGARRAPPPPPHPGRPPHRGVLRRERRALLRLRERRLRDLGGLMVEMYRRGIFREELLAESCADVVGIEDRLTEIERLLSPRRAPDRRCVCGVPVLTGAHFCPNCGRPLAPPQAGEETVIEPPAEAS